MSKWQDMKKGEIYQCPECGLKLQVVEECASCDGPWTCDYPCNLSRCEEEMAFQAVGMRGSGSRPLGVNARNV